jgi:hypothetical protein
MARKRRLDVQFPLAGLNRKLNYQSQPPYTTMDCKNVRPVDVFARRQRGGSRPGTGSDYTIPVTTGTYQTVRWIGSVDFLKTSVQAAGSYAYSRYTGDDFRIVSGESLSSSLWTAATWIDASLPSVIEGYGITVGSNTHRGAIYRNVSNINTTDAPYEVAIYVVPYQNEHWGAYSLFLRMNNTTPAALTDGLQLELVLEDGGQWTVNAYKRISGVTTTTTYTGGSNTLPATGGWFRAVVLGDNIDCYWQNDAVFTGYTVTDAELDHPTNYRTGFSLHTTIPQGAALIDSFMLAYTPDSDIQTLSRELCCIVDDETAGCGRFRNEAAPGVFDDYRTSRTFGYKSQIQAAEYLQKLYFTDFADEIFAAGSGTITSGRLGSASYTSWNATTLNTFYQDAIVTITSGTGTVVNGVYTISNVNDTTGLLLVDSSGVTASTTGNCNFRVVRGVKYYDPNDASVSPSLLAATAGTTPQECRLIAVYRDRLVLAGAPSNPHVWYMSRQGTPTDWDYSVGDAGGAVAGTSTTTAQIGEPITCLAPSENDYLIIGCTNSLWVLRGDPAYNGEFDNLSRNIGVLGPNAWCRGPGNEFIFLSKDGLYMCAGASAPISVSRERLPQELLNVDTSLNTVTLAYDHNDRGVHIFITPLGPQTSTSFWLDWETKSFWPVIFADNDYQPFCAYRYTAPWARNNAVLLGCRGDTTNSCPLIATFKPENASDGDTNITSSVQFGPFKLGTFSDGLLNQLMLSLSPESADVTLTVQTAKTGELSKTAGTFETTTNGENLNKRFRPRMRGPSMTIKITGSSGHWAFEQMEAEIEAYMEKRP